MSSTITNLKIFPIYKRISLFHFFFFIEFMKLVNCKVIVISLEYIRENKIGPFPKTEIENYLKTSRLWIIQRIVFRVENVSNKTKLIFMYLKKKARNLELQFFNNL